MRKKRQKYQPKQAQIKEGKTKSIYKELSKQQKCKELLDKLDTNTTDILYWYSEQGELYLLPLFDIGEDEVSKAFFDSLAELENVLGLKKGNNEDDLASALDMLAGA